MATLLAALLALLSQFSVVQPVVPQTVPETTLAVYEPLTGWSFGSTTVEASLATTSSARERGLSGTTVLPTSVVKLFVFPSSAAWSFWMKDMQYSIDIIWVSENGNVVHIEESVAPATYPKTFSPPVPAQIVIETVPGLAAASGVEVGSMLDIASFLAEL